MVKKTMTIKDIAQEAGVSAMTVSNVIHGKQSSVSPETAKKILKIMADNHYTPNMSARSLVSKDSKIIGVINHLYTNEDSIAGDPFFDVLIRSIEKELSARGYYMMFKSVENESELLTVFSTWNLSGIIMIGVFEDDFFRELSKTDVPCVLIDSYADCKKMYHVRLDDEKGGYIATKHLIEMGHRKIAIACPSIKDPGVISERFKGYRRALEEADIRFSKKDVFEVDSIIHGKELAQKIAMRRDITAVFTTADILATGIISGLQEHGIKVPKDISVMGFDDNYTSEYFSPPLTSVHQDIQEKGRLSVSILLDVISGKNPDKITTLPVSLVLRKSVKKITGKQ